MKKRVLDNIEAYGAEIIVFDIDGTLVNLIGEHQETLNELLSKQYSKKRLRSKLVLLIDRLAMWFVKSGVFPTNAKKQGILTFIYAVILNENIKTFKKLYADGFARKCVFFTDTKQMLEELLMSKEVYFATKNSKHLTLNHQYIDNSKIVCASGEKKLSTYQKLVEEKGLDKTKVLIVGDNLFDDVMVGKKLGVKSMLVDNYNSKTKRIIAKVLNVGI